jgi:hypothetical protein
MIVSGIARAAGTVLRAYASFLRALPATLRKRRAIQRARRVSPAAFAALVRTGYPPPV